MRRVDSLEIGRGNGVERLSQGPRRGFGPQLGLGPLGGEGGRSHGGLGRLGQRSFAEDVSHLFTPHATSGK